MAKPEGRAAAVVMTGYVSATTRVKDLLPVQSSSSVTVTVKLKVPAPPGLPESRPPLSKVRPAGSVPELTT